MTFNQNFPVSDGLVVRGYQERPDVQRPSATGQNQLEHDAFFSLVNEVTYNEIIIARREWNSMRYGDGSRGELDQYIREEWGGRRCLVLRRNENGAKVGVMRHFLARLTGNAKTVQGTGHGNKISACGFIPDSGEMQRSASP